MAVVADLLWDKDVVVVVGQDFKLTTQESMTSGIPNFTPDQWTSLANFLNSQKQSPSDKLSSKQEKLYFFGKESKYDIIIDSGASHHMTRYINLLTNLSTFEACPISLPDGQLTWATRHGSLQLGCRLVLNIVFYAFTLKITSISVAQLLGDIAGFVLFMKTFCVIQDLISKILISVGEERDEVYHYTGVIDVQAGHVGKFHSHELSYGIVD